MLPDFRLEAYFSRWPVLASSGAARYHLTASDAQTMSLRSLLALDDDGLRRRPQRSFTRPGRLVRLDRSPSGQNMTKRTPEG
jgi:hypothetical protein